MKDILLYDTHENELRERAEEVSDIHAMPELRQAILDAKEVVREKNLFGLAANEIGYNFRFMVLRFKDDSIKTLINPVTSEYLETNALMSTETCETLPGRTFVIPRCPHIKVTYLTPLGKIESMELAGLGAVVYQQCEAHLNGSLLCDIGMEVFDDYLSASEEEQDEVLRAYAESLDIREKMIKQDIKDDPESKRIWDAIEFMQALQSGKIELAQVDEEGNIIENGNNKSTNKKTYKTK